MKNVFTKIQEDDVHYYMNTENGEKEISHKEYVAEVLKEADALYESIVKLAKSNGCVWTTWIQQHFKLDWVGASHVIDRMVSEGICDNYDPKFGANRILVSN